MDYPPDAFMALVHEVEYQGGALLPEQCLPSDVHYAVPPYQHSSTQERVTCGCGNQSRFVSTYNPADPGGAGFVTACAVCDNVGAWPRYCEAVYSVDPELNPAFHDEEDDDADD